MLDINNGSGNLPEPPPRLFIPPITAQRQKIFVGTSIYSFVGTRNNQWHPSQETHDES
jgi:hypothetical protein